MLLKLTVKSYHTYISFVKPRHEGATKPGESAGKGKEKAKWKKRRWNIQEIWKMKWD